MKLVLSYILDNFVNLLLWVVLFILMSCLNYTRLGLTFQVCDRPPIIQTYQRKGTMAIAPPAAQTTIIRYKHHPCKSHTSMEAYQDNSRNWIRHILNRGAWL